MIAKILLVDDRPENLVALEAALRPLGQHLVSAQSGEEALRCLLTEEFAQEVETKKLGKFSVRVLGLTANTVDLELGQ